MRRKVVRLGNLCHPMVHVIRWLQACCCVSVLVLAVFFSLVYQKMLWHIRFFEFVFLGIVFCMLHVGLLMIPNIKNPELLHSQSQQVAASKNAVMLNKCWKQGLSAQ